MKLSCKAFTLIELLIIIVIIGVMVALVVPSISTGSDYARLKAASRGVVQLSRYSKTMALLHQKPVDLVFSSDGKLSVKSVGGGGESLVSAASFARTNLVDDSSLEAEDIEAPPISERKKSSVSGGGSSYKMADLEIEQEYEQITYRFEGYADTIDDGSGLDDFSAVGSFASDLGEDAEEATSFRIHYKSNGTCRPFRVRVIAGGDESIFHLVAVNMLGSAKVLEEDEW